MMAYAWKDQKEEDTLVHLAMESADSQKEEVRAKPQDDLRLEITPFYQLELKMGRQEKVRFTAEYYKEKRADILMVQLFPEAWMNVQWWKQHQREVESRRWNACLPQQVPMALECHKLPSWRDTDEAENVVFRNPGNGGHPAKNSWDRWTLQQRRMFLDCSMGIRNLTEYERVRDSVGKALKRTRMTT